MVLRICCLARRRATTARRAINELKEKEFSTRCPVCGNKDIFFGIEAVEVFHGELSALEKLELDEDEMREFDVDNEEDERR